MKKFTFLLAFLPTLFATSCIEGDEITEITQIVAPNVFTEVYRIYAEDMTERMDLAGTYYEYEFEEPKLTNTVFDTGVLQAFLYYKKDGKDTMCPLPFSDFVVYNGYQWEEQFTVEFQPYRIKFIQKISDHFNDLPISEYYDIMVRFLW